MVATSKLLSFFTVFGSGMIVAFSVVAVSWLGYCIHSVTRAADALERIADAIEERTKESEVSESTVKDMNRRTIRFSYEYPKLHGQTSAELLAVRPLKIDAHTPRELIEYDTTYEGGRYPLRSGKYIQLIFLGNLRIPFCTIRSAYPPSKVAYYYGSVGSTFVVEVQNVVRTCDTCIHCAGVHQQEIDFDTGDFMLVASCDCFTFATPDNAKTCALYQRRAAK